MKYLYLFIGAFTLISCKTSAQLNDFQWLLGHLPNKPEEYFGGVRFDFNEDVVMPKYFETTFNSYGATMISNNDGALIAISDGCNIYGGDLEIAINGDSLSYGKIWDLYCESQGYPGTQHLLFLPWPNNPHKAMLLHVVVSDDYKPTYLDYSIVEFSEDFQLVNVSERNTRLLAPNGSCALITATKHANGRDWWVIMPEDETNKFYTFLLDPNGISLVSTQAIGIPWGIREWGGQAMFSPSGNKYIRFNPWKGLDIFKFDRCSGELSDVMELGTLTDPIQNSGGLAMSNDSRFLYVSNSNKLFQFNMFSSNILESKILIAEYDGYINPFPTNFYQMRLGPDGKIYVFSANGVRSLHVINHPEKMGLECDFRQHEIELPVYIGIGAINFPFYRLGPDDGGQCDTLGLNNIPVALFKYQISSGSPLNVSFTNLSYANPTLYNWSFGDGGFSNLFNPGEISYSEPGIYDICLTVKNEFGENTFCRNIVIEDSVTAVTNLINGKRFEILPNPCNESFSLKISDYNLCLSLTLRSIDGKVVLKQDINSNSTMFITTDILPGIYIYTLNSCNGDYSSGKLIIRHT